MPLRKLLPPVLLLIASSVLSLGLVEGVFRVFSISYPELSADFIAAGQSSPVPYDRERVQSRMKGMIDGAFRNLTVDPELFGEHYTRVLFLGDSFTQGAGLGNLDDRFSNLLERRFNEELASTGSDQRVDIMNGGVGGTNPTHWIRYFQLIEPVYRPDLVVAIFFLRDGAPFPTSLIMNREEIEPIRDRYRALPGYGSSQAVRFAYHKLAWREYGEQFKHRLTAAYVGSDEETTTWRQRRPALARIAKACRARAIPFHLVIFPILLNLDDYEFFAVEDEITRFARRKKIPVFSLTPGFLGEEDRSLWVSPVDQHANARGHRIAADTLHPYLGEALAARAP